MKKPKKNKKSGVLQTDAVATQQSAQSQDPSPGQLAVTGSLDSDYTLWTKRCQRARKMRDTWEREYEVEECENYLIGRQYGFGKGRGPALTRGDQVVLNHMLATVKVIIPNLVYQAPKYFVRATAGQQEPAHEEDARTAEAVLETIATKHQNLKRAAKLAVFQNFTRIGVLKVIYDPRMVPNPNAGEPVTQTDPQGAQVKGPDGAPLLMRDPLTQDPMTEPEKILREDLYRWEWVDARFMLLPDEGPDMSKWSWVGEEIVVPLAEAKADDRFPKELRTHFTSNITDVSTVYSRQARTKPVEEPDPMFRYYEVYDLKEKRQLLWADGQQFEKPDQFLINRPIPPGLTDHPYAILLGWTPILGPDPLPWPYPYVKDWLGPQREYNIRRQQIMEGAKRGARKFFYDDNTFPNEMEAAKALQNPQDMVGAKLNDVARPPIAFTAPDINPAIYRDIPLILGDWRIITGQTGARLSSPDADTATEASFVERAANLRDADLQDSVNDWLSVAGMKMYQLVRETLTLNIWIKLRGFSDKEFLTYAQQEYGIAPQQFQAQPALKELFLQKFGQEMWKPISQEDLDFEADVTVVPGSSRPRNLDVERRQWMQFMQTLGQFPQLALSRELLRITADKFEGISDKLLDELTALAQKMVQIQANQAGRNQGAGAAPEAGANGAGGQDQAQALLAAMTGGAH